MDEPVELLKYCNRRLDEVLADEKSRELRAEEKAGQVLSFCGLEAIVMTVYAAFAFPKAWETLTPVLIIYTAAAVLITRSAYYCLKVMEPLRGHQVRADIGEYLSEFPFPEALQKDLDVKAWICEKNVQVANAKQFYLHRAVRNAALLVIGIFGVGAAILADQMLRATAGHLSSRALVCATLVLLVLVLLSDWIAEYCGDLWSE